MGNGAARPSADCAQKRSRWSGILGAPIRVGCASPLRVATDGDANWSSKVRRRRSPAHTNRRRDFVIRTMNAGQYVELFEGPGSRRSKEPTGRDVFAIHDAWTLGLRSRRLLSSQTWENNIRENLKTNFRKY